MKADAFFLRTFEAKASQNSHDFFGGSSSMVKGLESLRGLRVWGLGV